MSSVNLVASYPIPAKNTLTIDEFEKEVNKYCVFVERYLKSQAFLSLSAQQKKQVLTRLLKTADQLRGKVSNWRMLFPSGQFLVANGKLIQTVTVLNNLIEKNTPSRRSSQYYGTVFVPIGGCTPYSISCEDTILSPLVNSSATLKDGKVLFSAQLPQMPETVKNIRIRLEIFQKKDGKEIKVAEAEGQRNQEIKNLTATGNISLTPGIKATFIFKTYAVDPNCPKPVQGNPIEVVLQIPGDTTPPAQVSEEKAEAVTADFTKMRVAWKNPADADLKRIIVLRGKVEDVEKINAFVLTPKMLETIEKNVGGVQIAEGVYAAYATPLADKETPSASKEVLVSGLQADTEYVFRFFTVDAAGNINSASKVVTGKTAVDATVFIPKPIENPQITKVTENSVDLSWKNPADDPNFGSVLIIRALPEKTEGDLKSLQFEKGKVYVQGDKLKNQNGEEVAIVAYITKEQTITDKDLTPNTQYHYLFKSMSKSDGSKPIVYSTEAITASGTTLPGKVKITKVEEQDRALTVSYEFNKYPGFQKIQIYYSVNPITDEDIKNNASHVKLAKEITDDSSPQNISISNLLPDTKYYIGIRTVATNPQAQETAGEVVFASGKTLVENPPNKVKNVRAENPSYYSLQIKWDEPAPDQNPANNVNRIEVRYSLESNFDFDKAQKTACDGDQNLKSCIVGDSSSNPLKPNTAYRIFIASYNKNGRVVETFTTKTKELETISISNFTSAEDSITLNWNIPTNPEANQIRIYYSTSKFNNIQGISYVDVDASKRSYTLAKLSSNTEYWFATAINDRFGNIGEAIIHPTSIRTSKDTTAPAQVAGAGAVAKGRSIEISWVNPSDSDFNGVLISVKPKNGGPEVASYVSKKIGANWETTWIVTADKLLPKTEYTIEIRSQDDKTPPNISQVQKDPINATTEALPLVSGVVVVSKETGFDISWVNPSDSDIDGTVIVIKKLDAIGNPIGNPTTYQKQKGEAMLSIGNLESNTKYRIEIMTKDNRSPINLSDPYPPITQSTGEDKTPPDPVTTLKVQLDSTKIGADLTWTEPASRDAGKYVIVYSTSDISTTNLNIPSGSTFLGGEKIQNDKNLDITVAKVVSHPTLQANISNLPEDKTVYFMVIPVDQSGNYQIKGNSVQSIKTEDITPPAAVSSFSAKSLPKGNAIELSWIGSVSPDLALTGTYVIFASKDKTQLPTQADLAKGTVYKVGDSVTGKSGKVVFVGDKTATSFEHNGLGDDEIWNYAIFVKDTVGNYSVASTSTAKTYGAATLQSVVLGKGTFSGIYLDTTGRLTLKYFEPVADPKTTCLWSMEQNSILNNANPICNGKITGNATYVDGLPGSGKKVLSFDGNNFINIPHNSAFEHDSFSVSYFEYPTTLEGQMRIAKFFPVNYGWHSYAVPPVIPSGLILFRFNLCTGTQDNVLDGNPSPLNSWVHVGLSYSAINQTMQFFTNGNLVGKRSTSKYSSAQNLGIISIGNYFYTSGSGYFGRLANIHFESQARSSFDIYGKNGNFISEPIDLKSENNNLGSEPKLSWTATGIISGKSSIKFQIRTADSASNLQNAKWGGLDAQGNYLEGGYYTNSGSIIKLPPGAKKTVMEVRAIFEGNGVEKPILEKVWIENLRTLNP
ncbi:MAG: hypothetical protein FD145_1235 [Candidatus Saganbacteria bacterium]|uniref:Fibronectin type-III domain-containing protein n=1 Tax=Candidatus Saganbacteria bacterium TaxID=2575572 RepID=A0A833P2W5_UNCSA|nr:MAG: hypothetical protein FD145_1235 [Candidatus Saganbacteria bacterium]